MNKEFFKKTIVSPLSVPCCEFRGYRQAPVFSHMVGLTALYR